MTDQDLTAPDNGNKPCPFCGKIPQSTIRWRMDTAGELSKVPAYTCDTCGITMYAGEWNTRQIEDAQAARITELEAQLAAVPKWTRITDYRSTWPPEKQSLVLTALRGGYALVPRRYICSNPGLYDYWLPITPPTETDNE